MSAADSAPLEGSHIAVPGSGGPLDQSHSGVPTQSLHAQDHTHDHGHSEAHDQWSGEEYIKKPNVKEMARTSAAAVINALQDAGLEAEDMNRLHCLEIGCGPGLVTSHLTQSFSSVHGIDVSPSMLLTFADLHRPPSSSATYSLHALSPSSPATFASLTPLPCPTRSEPDRALPPPRSRWDIAVANQVLHHVDHLSDFFAGALGLLEDGGWIVFTEMGRVEGEVDKVTEYRQLQRKTGAGGPHKHHHHHHHDMTVYSPESITKLLEEQGLVGVHAEIKGDICVFGPDHPMPHLVARGRKPPASSAPQ